MLSYTNIYYHILTSPKFLLSKGTLDIFVVTAPYPLLFCFVLFLVSLNISVFIHLISEELKNAQTYTKDFKQQILDLRGTFQPP